MVFPRGRRRSGCACGFGWGSGSGYPRQGLQRRGGCVGVVAEEVVDGWVMDCWAGGRGEEGEEGGEGGAGGCGVLRGGDLGGSGGLRLR